MARVGPGSHRDDPELPGMGGIIRCPGKKRSDAR